jgi:hypothetical protein
VATYLGNYNKIISVSDEISQTRREPKLQAATLSDLSYNQVQAGTAT